MAYHDENGRITIDEVAAQADIRKIETAITALNNSKKAINNLIHQATSEQGQTSTAVIEKATEMRNQIDAMIARLSETASFISRTVAHYQRVDQKLKEAINAASSASNDLLWTSEQATKDFLKSVIKDQKRKEMWKEITGGKK